MRNRRIEVPLSRFAVDAFYDADPDAKGKSYVGQGSFVRDVSRFEPEFFGISPREALTLDPQHRLLLEAGWTALEDADYDPRNSRIQAPGVCGHWAE